MPNACAVAAFPSGLEDGEVVGPKGTGMSEVAVKTPLQYLDQAMGRLRDLGLVPEKSEEAPIVGLLEKIADIEPDKIAIITRTLQQMSVFNEVVREQVAQMSVAQRYEEIAKAFDSIRDDAKSMVD